MEKMRLKLDVSFMELGVPDDTYKILVSCRAYKRWQRSQLSLKQNYVLS